MKVKVNSCIPGGRIYGYNTDWNRWRDVHENLVTFFSVRRSGAPDCNRYYSTQSATILLFD